MIHLLLNQKGQNSLDENENPRRRREGFPATQTVLGNFSPTP